MIFSVKKLVLSVIVCGLLTPFFMAHASTPGAPTSVSATAGNTTATVTFVAPSNTGGFPITGYTVTAFVSNVQQAGPVDSNAGSTSLSHVVTGLTNGTTYTFKVKATNSQPLTSAFSSASASVTPSTVPDAPGGKYAISGDGQATVVFATPASNGGATITGYTVTSSPAGGTDTHAGTTGLSHTVTGLTNGTEYTFTVTATNSRGTSTASNTITPDQRILVGGGPTEMTLVGEDLYVLNAGDNSFSVIDVNSNTITDTISGIGDEPRSVTLVGTKLYVLGYADDTVSVVDTSTNTVTATIAVGDEPWTSLLVGSYLYISNLAGDTVSVINTNTNTVTDTISVGDGPYVLKNISTKIYVLNSNTNTVSVINTNTNLVTDTVTVGSGPTLATFVGTDLYVYNYNDDSVSVVDTNTNTVTDTISDISTSIADFNILVDDILYYVNSGDSNISWIDTNTNTVVDTLTLGTYSALPILYGTDLYIPNNGDGSVGGTISVVDTNTNTITDTITAGFSLSNLKVVGNKIYATNNTEDTVAIVNTVDNSIMDVNSPVLLSFTSSTANGTYSVGDDINITANFGKNIGTGSTMTVLLNTGVSVVLNTVSGTTLTGTYTPDYGDTPVSDLTISSISSASVSDTLTYTPDTYTAYSLAQIDFYDNSNLGESSNIHIEGTEPVVPFVPLSVSATVGDTNALISFSAPANDGGSSITGYTVTSSPGSVTATGTTSPILVTGLNNDTRYTFTVIATNAIGNSANSDPSNSVVPTSLNVSNSNWYNTSWGKRRAIVVTGSTAGAQENYQIKIELPYATSMKTDFSDIRFTDFNGTSLLNHWMESKTDGVSAIFWVKVPYIPISPNTINIYVYYGNPSVASTSNGDNTFTFFDTFGTGGTTGDWDYTYNHIGEHSIIHDGKLYVPKYNNNPYGGISILNPETGAVIKNIITGGAYLASTPLIDKNGYIHLYNAGSAGFLKKIDETTGTVVNTLSIPRGFDWETLTYDSENDVIIAGQYQGGSGENAPKLRGISAVDYTTVWTNPDITFSNTTVQLAPPLIVGPYLYVQDAFAVFYKVLLADGTTVASTTEMQISPSKGMYANIIYDEEHHRLYVTNMTGHTVYAVDPDDLSIIWSKTLEDSTYSFFRGGAYHNNVLYVTPRVTDPAEGFSNDGKLYALNADTGDVIWESAHVANGSMRVSSVLVDDDYVYIATNVTYGTEPLGGSLRAINIVDGSLAFNIPTLAGVSSGIPVAYKGKLIMDLWYQQGSQAFQVKTGGGTGDFYYKADLYQTGYIGDFMTGSLTSRTTCSTTTLDSEKWTATGYAFSRNCEAFGVTNFNEWANYMTSNDTFTRSNTAIRARVKNSEPTSDSYDTFLGLTSSISETSPIYMSQKNGNIIGVYDQNGSLQTTTGGAYTFDEFNIQEIKMAYPYISLDYNDASIVSTPSWSTSYNTLPIKFGSYKSTAQLDWIFARKYVYPEPSSTRIGEVSLASSSVVASSNTGGGGVANGGGGAGFIMNTSNTNNSAGSSGKTLIFDLGNKTLKQGVKGNSVKELQKFLNTILKTTNKVDGILGKNTINLIKKWQKENGLKPDGIVGPKTKAKMNSLNLKVEDIIIKVK
jgi:YVTN family beta-propeller protein